MHILIASPTYGGVGAEFMRAVLDLQMWLVKQGIGVTTAHHGMAEVARSRNLLATGFYEQPELTHLLFVDSDIHFEPEAVAALIAADRPLVGCVYPRRTIDYDRLIAAARRLTDRRAIIASAMDYVVVPDGETLELENGLCRVAGIGMGLCLIRRDVFEGLMATGGIKQDFAGAAGRALKGPVLGFFDPIPSETGFIAEDLSFCRRWRDAGGDVWACIDQDIAHVGLMTFRARMIDALTAGQG
ncbi:MAG TPA: hypothetical protein VL460_05855 [Caulobacteraceae bacterium]|jgi:hypothetical protein|nr:hypothetical protein [Caulobacteraceae bacterium]